MERGVHQIELSLNAHVERSRLSRLENGWENPKPDEVERIARALGVSTDALAMRESAR
jgi:transcriptional regulator with XRE-family HTH domain